MTPVTHWRLKMSNGALFGVPIPEAYEATGEELQSAVETAIVESVENGVNKRGKEVTPWLLKRVGELTQGKSLTSSAFSAQFLQARLCSHRINSDVALIENTALVGGRIAVAYSKIATQSPDMTSSNVRT